jgi:hypothetical protein|tara:strand:+ start:544 stop:720 length:177 start_codon:yes stop_codon:yes gene_type:complete
MSLYSVFDAEARLEEQDTSESITLRVIDSDKNYMDLIIFSEDEKFPAKVLKVFGLERD